VFQIVGPLLLFLLFCLRDAELEFVVVLGKLDDVEEVIGVFFCGTSPSIWCRGISIRFPIFHCHRPIGLILTGALVFALLLVGKRVYRVDRGILLEVSLLEASFEALVIAILDLIVIATWEVLEHLRPFGTDLLVKLNKSDVLFFRPLILDNARVDPV